MGKEDIQKYRNTEGKHTIYEERKDAKKTSSLSVK
jgi:hypothetical protein